MSSIVTEGLRIMRSSAGSAASILSIHSVSIDLLILLLVSEVEDSAEPRSILASSNCTQFSARDLKAEYALFLISS